MINAYQRMMPQIMATIQALAAIDEDKATTCFELLDELCENEISVIAPHVKPLINMCLAIASNKSSSDPLRVKAISFIGWLARTKKKALVKHKLVEPIIGTNGFMYIYISNFFLLYHTTNAFIYRYIVYAYVISS